MNILKSSNEKSNQIKCCFYSPILWVSVAVLSEIESSSLIFIALEDVELSSKSTKSDCCVDVDALDDDALGPTQSI